MKHQPLVRPALHPLTLSNWMFDVMADSGQAQRLQIARALARAAKELILDECSSASDLANQAAVREMVRGAEVGCTTLVVMHKVPVMMMCDRIVLVSDGVVREQGMYES